MSVSKSSVSVPRRGRKARALQSTGIARSVVLDQIGFVKYRRGNGVLRLKLVGPTDVLRRLRLEEGERLAIVPGHLIGERAA